MLANVLLRVLSYLFLEQNARSLQQPSSAAIFPGTVFLGALSWGRPTLSPLHPCSTEGGGRRKKPPKRGGWKWCGQALPHQVRVLFGAPGAGMQERAPEGSWRPKISGLARDTGDGDGGSSPRRNTSLRRSYPGLPDRSLPGRIACLLPFSHLLPVCRDASCLLPASFTGKNSQRQSLSAL